MTSYDAILDAADHPDYNESIRRVKNLAANTLTEADREAKLFNTENFNHSYLPDFVLRWSNGRPDRFVFLRATSYAEEIEEDVVNLSDRNPIFLKLSEFRSIDQDSAPAAAVESLGRIANASKSLVASVPAIEALDGPRSQRTGQILSSYVMRGGKGLVEDATAPSIAAGIEDGFSGALEQNRSLTANALDLVHDILDVKSSAEFTHLFEAAWISSGASVTEFPGAVTSIGDNLAPALLVQLLDIVPDEMDDFWRRIGNSIDLESFGKSHLVGDQPRLQIMMREASSRLIANRFSLRRTPRSDQVADPFIWQVENGVLSLRGGGHQGWFGGVPKGAEVAEEAEGAPTLSKISTRAENAELIINSITVRDADQVSVKVESPDSRDIATSDLVHRVSEGIGDAVSVDEVTARVNGKNLKIVFDTRTAKSHASSRISAANLAWNAWNLLAEVDESVRDQLIYTLNLGEDEEATEE